MPKKLKEFSKMNKKEMDKFKNDLKKEVMKEYTTYFNKKYKPSNDTLNLIQSYFTKPLNLKKPMNLKNLIDDKKKIQSNDNNLLKQLKSIKKINSKTIKLINTEKLGNLLLVSKYCPTKKVFDEYNKKIDELIKYSVDYTIQLVLFYEKATKNSNKKSK